MGFLTKVNGKCNIRYFIAFDDPDCSLLNSFQDQTFYNSADGACTPIGDGRAFMTDCNDDQVKFKVFDDLDCKSESRTDLIPFDKCSKFNDPFAK